MNTYHAIILGGIWWPMGALCSTERTYQAESDEDAILAAETTEAGDFSSVQDTRITKQEHCGQREHACLQCQHDSPFCPYLSTPTLVKDWANEENALAYFDTLGSPDEEESSCPRCSGDLRGDEPEDASGTQVCVNCHAEDTQREEDMNEEYAS